MKSEHGRSFCSTPFPRANQGRLRRMLPRNERKTKRGILTLPAFKKRFVCAVEGKVASALDSPLTECASISIGIFAGIDTSRSPEWLLNEYSPSCPGSPLYVFRPPPVVMSAHDS